MATVSPTIETGGVNEMISWLQDRDGGHHTSYHCHYMCMMVSGLSVKAGLWKGVGD